MLIPEPVLCHLTAKEMTLGQENQDFAGLELRAAYTEAWGWDCCDHRPCKTVFPTFLTTRTFSVCRWTTKLKQRLSSGWLREARRNNCKELIVYHTLAMLGNLISKLNLA